MYIHKKGYGVIATVILLAAIIVAAFWLFVPVKLFQIFMTVACSVIVFWSFTFFRVPTNRVTTIEDNAVVSAADGEVVVIEEVEEKEYFHDKFIVTGHTPTGFIDLKYKGRIWRKNNHIAVDCGAVFGNPFGCICLDNFEKFYVE